MNHELTCKYCTNEFRAKRIDAKYCSDSCRKQASRERIQSKQNNSDKIFKEIVNKPKCTSVDLLQLRAKISKMVLNNEGSGLLNELNLQSNIDKEIKQFEKEFGCTFLEAKSWFPENCTSLNFQETIELLRLHS